MTAAVDDVQSALSRALNEAFNNGRAAAQPPERPEPTGRNYNLRYVKVQQFYGYDTAAEALRAFADFADEHDPSSASLYWSPDDNGGGGSYGGTVTWEDI